MSVAHVVEPCRLRSRLGRKHLSELTPPRRRWAHVGDFATITQDAFAVCAKERAQGKDEVMLAPAGTLVSQLTRQARTHRLED